MTTVTVSDPNATVYEITTVINDVTYQVAALFGVGPRGPAGLQMLGPWDSATGYVTDDAVSHNGASWWAQAANTGVEPALGVAQWGLLAAPGDVQTVAGVAPDVAGNVALTASDVAALPDTTTIPSIASDVGALAIASNLSDVANAATALGNLGGVANAAGQTLTLWSGTAAAYAAIGTKDASTVYVVTA